MSTLDTIISKKLTKMKQRCTNKKEVAYKSYGARGIKVLITHSELKSLWIRDNADKMKRPSIDRIDPDGHYSVNNCRFIECEENVAMRRVRGDVTMVEINGVTKTLPDWAKKHGINIRLVYGRIYKGWDIARALSTQRISPEKTVCKRGHVRTPSNVYKNGRACRICRVTNGRLKYAAKIGGNFVRSHRPRVVL